MFAAIYGDTPPHGVDRVITSFPCSPISPQRSLCPQYDSSAVDNDDGDDISSQWSMSPDPPPPKWVATAAQHSLHLVPVTLLHGTMSSDLSSQNSVDLAAHGPSCPALSPYDSCGDGDTLSQWSMSSDPSSRKSDEIAGSTYPAPSPYDNNTDDCNDDVDDCGSIGGCGGGGGDTSPQWTISSNHASQKSDDIVTQGSICPACMPYDSSAANDNTDGDASSQWSMSLGLPSNAITADV